MEHIFWEDGKQDAAIFFSSSNYPSERYRMRKEKSVLYVYSWFGRLLNRPVTTVPPEEEKKNQ